MSTAIAYQPAAVPERRASEETPDQVQETTASIREPEHQEIAVLAYQYWEEGGRRPDSAEEDWLRAEESLRSR